MGDYANQPALVDQDPLKEPGHKKAEKARKSGRKAF